MKGFTIRVALLTTFLAPIGACLAEEAAEQKPLAPAPAATTATTSQLRKSTSEQVGHEEIAADAEQAVRAVLDELAAAINRGDANAVADLWTPEAVYLGPRGERLTGREEIRDGFAGMLTEHKDMRIEVDVLTVKILGDDVALVEAHPHTMPEMHELPGVLRASIVMVRHENNWLIERLDDLLIYRPTQYPKLKPLAWLVGDWVAHGPEGEVILASHCEWTTNRNFLLRTFSAHPPGRPPVSGTQMIGWDPRERCIRSWLFDSKGGILEGDWHREGDRWIIEAHGTLHDGREVHSRNIMLPHGGDRFTLYSTDRHVAGTREEDMGPLTIYRAPALPPPADDRTLGGESREEGLEDEPANLLPIPRVKESILP